LAEQQRRGVLVGLALASALIVLLASGVAVSRLGSDSRSGRRSPRADSSMQTGATPSAPGLAAGGSEAPAGDHTSGLIGEAALTPSASPSSSAAAATAAGDRSPVPTAALSPAPSREASAVRDSGSGAGGDHGSDTGSTSGRGQRSDGSAAGDGSPPAPQHTPGDESLVAASVSAGQGSSGGVVGATFGDSPDADVTVGTTPVVGDAPPSGGTAIGLGGRFVHPPPSVPVLPG
jgi:hypothetical protein